MQRYQLVAKTEDLQTKDSLQTVLFEGRFYSFKACLEQAVKDGCDLSGIDLSHKNLSNANLDCSHMPGANFTGTNLTGANLSECNLTGALFNGAALYNTFFCDSDLSDCNFENATFGATDIHGARLANTRFSTLSCFSLDFTRARHMTDTLYINPDGSTCRMSRPPIVIRGWARDPIILMDESVKSGHNLLNRKRLEPLIRKLALRALDRRLGVPRARAC